MTSSNEADRRRTVDPRIAKARGLTADANSLHIVVLAPRTEPDGERVMARQRVASFPGGDIDRARQKATQHQAQTGHRTTLERGAEAAYLPLWGHA